MELGIKNYFEELSKDRQSKDDLLKKSIKKAIEKAVHLNSSSSPQALAESISFALQKELKDLNQANEETLQYSFKILIETIQRPKEKEIEKLIIEIDRLQRYLAAEEEEMQRSLREIFIALEKTSKKIDKPLYYEWIEALENTELEHVEGLGILNETVEAALITALEESNELEQDVREVIRHITQKALIEGLLSAARIRAILYTILMKSSELAEATPNRAKELIHGTVFGINDALIIVIKQLKKQIDFAPEEIKTSHVANWEELIKMLSRSDELYKEIIDKVASKNSPFISEILQEYSDVIGDQFAELKRASVETLEVAKKRLTALAKEAVIKGSELKEQLANEAKRLGQKAWKKALKVAKAYKNKKEDS